MIVEPYLYFYGRCEQALAFYESKLGAKVQAKLRYKDAPGDQALQGEQGELIMHALFRIGETAVMASDGNPRQLSGSHSGFSLTLSVESVDEGKRLFEALGQGGQVTLPWQPTFFANGFGMLTDQFGVPWIVIAGKPAAA